VEPLRTKQDGTVVRVTMTRPLRRNAFDAPLISALHDAFRGVATLPQARVVVLAGDGSAFSAGADLDWMRAGLDLDTASNERDAIALVDMLAAIAACPLPVIARVHGAALGGGGGLVCAADVAVATLDAAIGFPEVRLGIIPAAISPYVVRRVGAGAARELFLTGRQVRGEEALRLGLVHHLVPDAFALDEQVKRVVADIVAGGPAALRETKRLLDEVAAPFAEGVGRETARRIARVRVGEEAQAGIRAFLDRKAAPWRSDAS
jgi:methylglutaconyl-CoA hydratase